MDVYPTTGWEGEIVTITGNNIFTNVQNVIIGGTATDGTGGTPCAQYDVISTSVILCKLPVGVHGASGNIAVLNGAPATNVTPVTSYTHMKITYFDPSQSTVTISTTNTDGSPLTATYDYYPNGFTGSDCAGLVSSNSTSMDIPASLVYVRDTRNNQVYKVKKMIDEKCWMIDNLKYIDKTIPNVDGTTGMTYNGAWYTWNTIDGDLDNQSTANTDKAFYNPMVGWNCYAGNTAYMAANTLTHCGYLYNWYAATAGTGIYAFGTNGDQAPGDICPTNFRLPSARSGVGGPTTDGVFYDVADLPVLNASMNAGSLTTGSNNSTYYTNWLPNGAWSGTMSWTWWGFNWDINDKGGEFWSSTVSSNGTASDLFFYDSGVGYMGYDIDGMVYMVFNSSTAQGKAVRCVMP